MIANKKRVDNTLGYEFRIEKKDVVERRAFGRFEIIRTKKGIMYKNYTGYHIWTTPYAVGVDGKAHEKTLYAWLNNLLDFAVKSEGREKEPYNGNGSPFTYADVLDSMKIMTEAALTHPMTVFSDEQKAMEFANDYIKWLTEQQELLEKTMNAPVSDENLKAEFEEGEKTKILDDAADMIGGDSDSDNDNNNTNTDKK